MSGYKFGGTWILERDQATSFLRVLGYLSPRWPGDEQRVQVDGQQLAIAGRRYSARGTCSDPLELLKELAREGVPAPTLFASFALPEPEPESESEDSGPEPSPENRLARELCAGYQPVKTPGQTRTSVAARAASDDWLTPDVLDRVSADAEGGAPGEA